MSAALRRRYGRAAGVKRKLTAVLPDGVEVTRTTTHGYTHVIAVKNDRGWSVWGWTTQPLKMIEDARRHHRIPHAVPVTSSVEIKAGKKRPMPEAIEYRGFKLSPVRRQPGFSIAVDRGVRHFFEDYSRLPADAAFASAKAKVDKFLDDAAFLRSCGWASPDDYLWTKPGMGRPSGELLSYALRLEGEA